VQTPANSGSGSNGPSGVEAGPASALNEGPPSQQIAVSVERVEDTVILHVAGEIDLLTAAVLGERLREHIDPSSRMLVLNLTEVSFLGSAGLAEIVSASQTGADLGARLVLVATNRAVLRPLEVTGLLSLFTVYETVDAAIAAAE
jgi:anti-anti-sigma factor